MERGQIPHSWIGQRVAALIVTPWSPTGNHGIPTRASLTALDEIGVLDDVNDIGIAASFEEEGAPPTSAFYPWSAVLRLHLLE